MKTFNMEVIDKRLVFDNTDGEVIVCGNGDYQIKFTFDAEWSEFVKKTARFTWNGEHKHVEFNGDTVKIPMVINTTVVTVGVFAGEDDIDEAPLATTKVTILCIEGSRCGNSVPNAGTGATYTNEAKGYALQAQEAAKTAQEAMASGEEYKGLEFIGSMEISELNEDGDGNSWEAWKKENDYYYVEIEPFTNIMTAKFINICDNLWDYPHTGTYGLCRTEEYTECSFHVYGDVCIAMTTDGDGFHYRLYLKEEIFWFAVARQDYNSTFEFYK